MVKLVHNVQKKQHKERSQTLDRAKYGLLEKKKDYKLRATDYHKKQAALKLLRERAANYNPDEYYHAMTRRRTDDSGIELNENTQQLTEQQMKLYKSQDLNYVRTMRLNERAKIDKLMDKLQFKAKGKHTVFVDSVDDAENFDALKHFQTDASLVNRRENRLRTDQLESTKKPIDDDEDFETREQREKQKLADYRLLKERLEREKQLKEVEEKLALTKELMKDGDVRKLRDQDGHVHYKWNAVRKR